MPLATFELGAVLVVVLTLAAMAHRGPASPLRLLADYFSLAVAGFVGEESRRGRAARHAWSARRHVVALLPLGAPRRSRRLTVFWLVARDSFALWVCFAAAAVPYLVAMRSPQRRGSVPRPWDQAATNPPKA